MMKTFSVILISILCTGLLAQTNDMAELTGFFDGKYEFNPVKKGMEVNFLKDNEIIRTEYFRATEINWEEIYFNENDRVIVITCKDFYPKCIDRKIIKTKSRNQYSKTTLKIDEARANEAIDLLKSLFADSKKGD